ncbi:hypothetical protein KBD81_00985 [Candidatus Woesebacteria bacterium]|nr:hypothetical protein [Candidatus Woesebacteria bacterium]
MKPVHIGLIGGLISVILVAGFVFTTNSSESTEVSNDVSTESTIINTPSPTEHVTPSEQIKENIPPTSTATPVAPSKKAATTTPQTDTTSPQAFILEPTNNAVVTFGADVKIVANVTDNVKVDRVEFYAGSSDYQRIGTVHQAPFEVIWNVDSRFENSINIPVYIKAFDTSGNRADSSILVVAKKP